MAITIVIIISLLLTILVLLLLLLIIIIIIIIVLLLIIGPMGGEPASLPPAGAKPATPDVIACNPEAQETIGKRK